MDNTNDAKTLELHTWKGKYELPLCPNDLPYGLDTIVEQLYKHYGYYDEKLAELELDLEFFLFYLLWCGKSSCSPAFHPIDETFQITIADFEEEIEKWVDEQPPAPDWTGAKEDRVQVEKEFTQFAK